MSLIPFRDIPNVKLVAAQDYFCRTPLAAWLSTHLVGILPIERNVTRGSDPLGPIVRALDEGYTVIIFPEGTRGEPEQRHSLKHGIAKIVERKPHVTVTPVFIYGAGKALPRGEALLVPFTCDINVGEAVAWQGQRGQFTASLTESFSALSTEILPKAWA